MQKEGIITKAIGGFYYVTDGEGVIYECKARGIFRKNDITPLVGDIVTVVEKSRGSFIINEIKPRKSRLVRPPIANVDVAIIVIAVFPEISLIVLDKLLVNVLKENINPLLCINKTDLDDENKLYNLIQKQYRKFDIIAVSAKTGQGIENLKNFLKGKISVFAGQSGVGKSSILNRLINGVNLKVGEISMKIERGRHTTRAVELLKLDNQTYVADTPGFSSVEIHGLLRDDLKKYYPEFIEYDNCRFPGCNHISEPDCHIKEAVIGNEIDLNRYERYKMIYMQLPSHKKFD